MATIRHPNIILFFGACFQVSPPVILLEYCPGGNLETRMIRFVLSLLRSNATHHSTRAYADGASSKERITPAQKYKYAIELARGMTFLHRCTIPIIHRDLKVRCDSLSVARVPSEQLERLTDTLSPKTCSSPSRTRSRSLTLAWPSSSLTRTRFALVEMS